MLILHGHAACGGAPVHRGGWPPPYPPTRPRPRQVAQPMSRATDEIVNCKLVGRVQINFTSSGSVAASRRRHALNVYPVALSGSPCLLQ